MLNQYWDVSVAPWVGKFKKADKKDQLILIASDFHAQWTDKFAFNVFKDTVKRLQPDVVVLNGDLLDLYDLSRYGQDPTAGTDVQGEVNYVTKGIFAQVREAAPNAQIDFVEGNHEWRLINYLTNTAPKLAGLECLEFGKLLKLDEFEINLVARRAFRREVRKNRVRFENFVIYGDNALLVTHGTCTGSNPAKAELDRWGMRGVSGHMHKPSSYTEGDLNGTRTWHVLGCMAKTSLSKMYMEHPAAWVQGFGYAEISGKHAQVTQVTIQGGWCSVAGKKYVRKGVASH